MADNTITPNAYLHKIKAPSLSDTGGYVKSLESSIEQINENFKTLASLPFMQGVKGDSYELVEKPIWVLKEGKSQYTITQEGVELINSIFGISAKEDDTFGTVKNLVDKTAVQIGNISAIDGFFFESEVINNILYFYAIKNDTGKFSNGYLGQMYYFIDSRTSALSSVYHQDSSFTDLLATFKDYTGFYQYNANEHTYNKLNILPTLYYDTATNDMCWQFSGNKTGISAIGPKGANGNNANIKYVKAKVEESNAMTANITAVFDGTTGKWTNKTNDICVGDTLIVYISESIDSSKLGQHYIGIAKNGVDINKNQIKIAVVDFGMPIPFAMKKNDVLEILSEHLNNNTYITLKGSDNGWHSIQSKNNSIDGDYVLMSKSEIFASNPKPTTSQLSNASSKFILNDYSITVQNAYNNELGSAGSTNSIPQNYGQLKYTKIDTGSITLGGGISNNQYKKLSINIANDNSSFNVISNAPIKISATNSTFASKTTFNGDVDIQNKGKKLTVGNLSGPNNQIGVDSDIVSACKITAKNIETSFGPVFNYSSKKEITSGVVGISMNKTYQVKNTLPIGTIMMYYGPISSTVMGEPMNVNENLVDSMEYKKTLTIINDEWAVCNGASVDINMYKEYYEITGKKEVPNFIGRMPLGTGKSYYPNVNNTYPTIYRGNYQQPDLSFSITHGTGNGTTTVKNVLGYPPSIAVNFIIKIK